MICLKNWYFPEILLRRTELVSQIPNTKPSQTPIISCHFQSFFANCKSREYHFFKNLYWLLFGHVYGGSHLVGSYLGVCHLKSRDHVFFEFNQMVNQKPNRKGMISAQNKHFTQFHVFWLDSKHVYSIK